MEARLASRKPRTIRSTRARRVRKGEPSWVATMRKEGAPDQAVNAALNAMRRLGVGTERGRPVVEIDEDSLASLARQGNTNEGIADILGISRSTLQAKLAESETLHDCYQQAVAMRHRDLRVAQYTHALRGNARLLVWLGIQELGQRSKMSISGEAGQPPVALSIADVVAIGAARLAEMEDAEADAAEPGERPD